MTNKLYVAWFLATRAIRRSSIWTSSLVILIMTFTFLNVVIISGILVGLIEGSSVAYRSQYSADILISKPIDKPTIENSRALEKAIEQRPEVKGFTSRIIAAGKIEANYKEIRKPDEGSNSVSTQMLGVDIEQEQNVTNIENGIIKGRYLLPGDEGKVIVGANLLQQYSRTPSAAGFENLELVDVGSKIRITIGEVAREFTVVGIFQSKIGIVSRRVVLPQNELRKLVGRASYDVDEIAVRLHNESDAPKVATILRQLGYDKNALIQTWEESQGEFFNDIKVTFGALGNIFGAIGLLVATVTMFIVIFINAINRKKFIGIMKGIGISGFSIELSYILQAFFYGLVGSGIGIALLYGAAQPYLAANPIDFPFSDGILVAPLDETIVKIGIILATTIIAGYLPSRLIVKKNTLDSILGR